MSDRSPPFTALRAVEAASRHRSFTGAARELQITHSAVSQSIRRLETELGARLFERKGGAMEPSTAALRLAQTYSEAQDALTKAIREIAGPEVSAAALSVSMPASFARPWFTSKLGRLSEALPDVDVRIQTRDEQGVDVNLSWSAKPSKTSLCELAYVPLCSPDFSTRLGGADVHAILRAPLIADGEASWSTWSARWAPSARAPRAHVFDDAGMALDAAIQAGGVVLSNVFAAETHLASGRLVALGFEVPAGEWLVVQGDPGADLAEAAERFVMWLRLEVRRSLALADRGAARS